MSRKKKIEIIQPKMPKTRKKEDVMPKSKRSVILHKKEAPVENLYEMLGEVERTIRELSRMYIEVPESRHSGVGGRMKPTEKQEMIKEQIDKAQKRADRLISLIDKL